MFKLISLPAVAFLILLTFLSTSPSSIILPSFNNLTPTPPEKIATVKSTVIPTTYPEDTNPWGVAKQVTDHTWVIKINNDPQMGSPEEILSALNDLRRRYGSQPLQEDSRLCEYAQERARYFTSIKDLDEHQGFSNFLQNENGFEKLGYRQLGENSSYGYVMSGVHLIEQVYNSDPDHSQNQLDPKWDHGCVGVSGVATNLIFATSPI